ncbi:fimbrial protein [Shimwellia blattae]|uniref:Putative CS1 type fimbrial major subunit n=1 Tax=Shimwellia blattae (strain ATCC 29907 / DSM 4481 / JCM 1650 / NBRC 105725 / CDC 9005-74) TaxID=630626 RepID=I2BD29_SHIBC|nr:fimbrial protein [Shimwellia blattae]AFJ48433.1 putative CS1 type fimbrial major subunit [Shimwellia blattae DSM 4481 = NBRC 105725]GAB82509.1 putative fimbrial major subunit [Shimwellia blattae DSM 4481 = NBRC 105725]VDY65927.1 Colonization factor antigen I subunit B [Shimwellia blattae]VEC26314.1 Colonization factor antigen I subunit B [Shimwellia blattae]
MKMNYKVAAVALASLFSVSALAVQKDITVVADIDTTIELLQADGSALPQTLRLTYLPGVGLRSENIRTKIFTNDPDQKVQVRLLSEPQLLGVTNPAAAAIPLSVSFNGAPLSTTVTNIEPTALYPTGVTDNGSVQMDLTIGQKTLGAVTRSGSYQGVVSLVLNTAAATPTP